MKEKLSVKKNNGSYKKEKNKNTDKYINEYYLKKAIRLKYMRYIVLSVLFIFVILSFITNSKELSFENLNYLLKYIDIQTNNKNIKTEFQIDADETSLLGYYKNNIVVFNKTNILLYDLNGVKNFTASCIYSNPVVETSPKYILTYDAGYSKMEIYNSFSKLYEYKGDSVIYNAKINEKGSVMYQTGDSVYRFAVHIKDQNFDDAFSFKTDKYIGDFDISEKGDRAVVAAYSSTAEGNYEAEITTLNPADDDYLNRLEYEDTFPFYVKCNDNGFFAVFNNCLKIFGDDDRLISNFDYKAGSLLNLTYSDKYISLNIAGQNNYLYVYDSLGEEVYSGRFDEKIIDMKFDADDKNLCLLTLNNLYKINIENKEQVIAENIKKSAVKILFADSFKIVTAGLQEINIISEEGIVK